jgi:hypothetical protein
MMGAVVAVQAIMANPVHAAEPALAVSPASDDSTPPTDVADPAAPADGGDLLAQLTSSGLEGVAGANASRISRALAVGPIVDTVAGLTGVRVQDPPSTPAAQPAGLLDLSDPGPSPAGTSQEPLTALLDGISSLVLTDGAGSGQPQPGGWQPVTTASAGAIDQPATTPVAAGPRSAGQGRDGSGPLGGGSPLPLIPDQPMPQPVPSQAPAGGGLGTSLSSGPGMAVAALFTAPPLLAPADRPPCVALPKWSSAEVVAIIERPG